MADASWMEGQPERAVSLWQRAIALDPAGSWRSYASLAAVSAAEGTDLPAARSAARPTADLSFLGPGAAARKPDPLGPKTWYGAMAASFPTSIGARTSYAAALIRLGRKAEAGAWLELPPADGTGKGGAAVKPGSEGEKRELLERLEVASALWPEGRLVTEAERLAAAYPEDGAVLEASLGVLLDRGYYDDFLVLYDTGLKRGLEYGRKPLFGAYAAMARGKADEALALLATVPASSPPGSAESSPTAGNGPGAAFARALLLEGKGDVPAAESAFSEALLSARGGHESCLIYKEMGRCAEGRGEAGKAAEAYAAAAAADPSDAEAARLSRR
jgi:tetratricopeptide (TPR) repeat protein